MPARGLRRDARGIGEFAGGQRSAIHQGQEHVRSRRLANQRGDFGNEGSGDHRARIAPIRDKDASAGAEAMGRDSVAYPAHV